ncbi:fructose-bisphosphatase class II [Patescibacteria group bacterium]|nr:fructose-bisphosphatase class II [Patescibacteria group bacterium]
MSNDLRFDVASQPMAYHGSMQPNDLTGDQISDLNHRHTQVFERFGLSLVRTDIIPVKGEVNGLSNLGAFRNRQLRESAIIAAAFAAMAVALDGLGSLASVSGDRTKTIKNRLKRANDRTAAQVMAEVLQLTTTSLHPSEDVIIESLITEGVRSKPGYEAGGNPTIAVGHLFGKSELYQLWGQNLPKHITQLSMGNDVIDGTGKSIQGLHSSLTALFLTESHIKRHLPDVYVLRTMSGRQFGDFNCFSDSPLEAAQAIAVGYGLSRLNQLSAFFLDRARHYPCMDILNQAGVATPWDKDGDLFPALVLGLDGFSFQNGKPLHCMINEIGGSAEWAVGVLPLVWRGGHALGMLTSHSNLSRKDVEPEQLWRERFNFTEAEIIEIDDARFGNKPIFTIGDILENPFAGGVSAFGAITDNVYMPSLKGVTIDREKNEITVNVLMINSLGLVKCWHLVFKCNQGVDHTAGLMASPKKKMAGLSGDGLKQVINTMLNDFGSEESLRIFFRNEYYPAIITFSGKIRVMHDTVTSLISRGALSEHDQEIIKAFEELFPEWFY